MNDHGNSLLTAAKLLHQASHLELLDLDEKQMIQILAVLDCVVAEFEDRLAELRTGNIPATNPSATLADTHP